MERRSGSARPSSLAFSFCRETETVSGIKRRKKKGEGPHKEGIQGVGIGPTAKDTSAGRSANPANPDPYREPVRLFGQIQSEQGGHKIIAELALPATGSTAG